MGSGRLLPEDIVRVKVTEVADRLVFVNIVLDGQGEAISEKGYIHISEVSNGFVGSLDEHVSVNAIEDAVVLPPSELDLQGLVPLSFKQLYHIKPASRPAWLVRDDDQRSRSRSYACFDEGGRHEDGQLKSFMPITKLLRQGDMQPLLARLYAVEQVIAEIGYEESLVAGAQDALLALGSQEIPPIQAIQEELDRRLSAITKPEDDLAEEEDETSQLVDELLADMMGSMDDEFT